MEWTEETISRLRSLWQEGLSTAEIGRRLSITKNAVVGKAHRLTLPPRPSPIRKADPTRAAKAAEAAAVRQASRQELRQAARVTSFAPRESGPAGAAANGATPAGPAARPPAESAPVASSVTHLRTVPRPADPAPRDAGAELDRAASRPAFTRRSQSCCWPLGEPGTKQFRFCGGDPIPGKPYCTEHAQLAYVKLRDRRDTVA